MVINARCLASTPRLGKPGYFDGWNESETSELKDIWQYIIALLKLKPDSNLSPVTIQIIGLVLCMQFCLCCYTMYYVWYIVKCIR